jgi:hypothetical protein
MDEMQQPAESLPALPLCARAESAASRPKRIQRRAEQRSPHRGRARASDQLSTARSGSEPSWAAPLTIPKKARRPSLSTTTNVCAKPGTPLT